MQTITEEQVLKALGTVMEPELHQDIVSLNFVRDIRIDGNAVSFTIMLTTPACPLKHVLQGDSERALRRQLPGIGSIRVGFDSQVVADKRIREKLDVPIKTILGWAAARAAWERPPWPRTWQWDWLAMGLPLGCWTPTSTAPTSRS